MSAQSNLPVDLATAARPEAPATAKARRRLFLTAFLMGGAAWLAAEWQGFPAKDTWPGAVLLLLAVAATIESLARNLPLEHACMAAATVAILSAVAQLVMLWANLAPDIGDGARRLGLHSDQAFNWSLPILSMVVILNSRGAARFVLRGWRNLAAPGYWTIAMAGVLAATAEFNLAPRSLQSVQGWGWLAGSTLTTLLILLFTTPWLINKKPGEQRACEIGPLILWLGMNLLLAVANFCF